MINALDVINPRSPVNRPGTIRLRFSAGPAWPAGHDFPRPIRPFFRTRWERRAEAQKLPQSTNQKTKDNI